MRKILLLLCTALASITSYADTWTKVTTEADLTTDGEYLIVCQDKNVVMSSVFESKYMKEAPATIIDYTIETIGTEQFAVVTFEGTLTSCKVKISKMDGTLAGYYTTTAAKSMKLSDNSIDGTDAAVSLSSNGDEVSIVFGKNGTLKYNSSNPRFVTYESGQTAIQLYKKQVGGVAKTPVTMSFPSAEYSANFGETFTSPELTVDPAEAKSEVVYKSSDQSVATIDENGVVNIIATGSTKITATISGSATYQYATAEYLLIVIDPNNPSDKIVFANQGYTNGQAVSEVKQGDIVTLNFTNAKYYNTGKAVRLYSGGTLTISVPEKYVLTKVISTFSQEGTALEASNGTFNSDTDYTTWIAGTSTRNTVVFTNKGDDQWRFESIEVFYKEAADPNKQNVTLTFDGGDMTETFESGKTVQGRVATADVEGLEISYTSSDVTVATVDATGMLTLVGPGTTTITAQTAETTEYNAGQASYTLTVDFVYNSIADVLTYAKKDAVITLNFAMTVGYVNGKYVYVTDNQGGYILIYGKTAYKANNIIPVGMSATYTVYNGLPELKPTTQPKATEQGTYEIETIAAADVMSRKHLNKIVKIENVNFTEATPASGEFTGNAELKFYNQFGLASVAAGDYDVIACVGTKVTGATEIADPSQLQPIEYIALPKGATATIGDTQISESYELKGSDVIVILTAAEGESIWYKFTETTTQATTKALEGYQAYPAEGIKISKQGKLEYYTELNDRMSAVTAIEFTGTPASISEISAADGAATEWYDLSGRRVASPAKGVFIKKTGSKVSKVVF